MSAAHWGTQGWWEKEKEMERPGRMGAIGGWREVTRNERVRPRRDRPQRSGGVPSTSELASSMLLVSARNGGSRGRT